MKTNDTLDDRGDTRASGPTLDCSLTVNAVLAHFPSTFRVFNRFGVDTCCSGVLTVQDAALANGIDAAALCGALREALFV